VRSPCLEGYGIHISRGQHGSPLLEGEGQGEVCDLFGDVPHLTPTLSFQEREPRCASRPHPDACRCMESAHSHLCESGSLSGEGDRGRGSRSEAAAEWRRRSSAPRAHPLAPPAGRGTRLPPAGERVEAAAEGEGANPCETRPESPPHRRCGSACARRRHDGVPAALSPQAGRGGCAPAFCTKGQGPTQTHAPLCDRPAFQATAFTHLAGSAGPLSWKERDRVRCANYPKRSHTSPQPSPSRRGRTRGPHARIRMPSAAPSPHEIGPAEAIDGTGITSGSRGWR